MSPGISGNETKERPKKLAYDFVIASTDPVMPEIPNIPSSLLSSTLTSSSLRPLTERSLQKLVFTIVKLGKRVKLSLRVWLSVTTPTI